MFRTPPVKVLSQVPYNRFCKEKPVLILIITRSALKCKNVCKKQEVITKRAGMVPLIQLCPKFHGKTFASGIPVLITVSSKLQFQSKYFFDKGTGA